MGDTGKVQEKKLSAFKAFKYRRVFEIFIRFQESSPYQSFKVAMLNKKFLRCATKYYQLSKLQNFGLFNLRFFISQNSKLQFGKMLDSKIHFKNYKKTKIIKQICYRDMKNFQLLNVQKNIEKSLAPQDLQIKQSLEKTAFKFLKDQSCPYFYYVIDQVKMKKAKRFLTVFLLTNKESQALSYLHLSQKNL